MAHILCVWSISIYVFKTILSHRCQEWQTSKMVFFGWNWKGFWNDYIDVSSYLSPSNSLTHKHLVALFVSLVFSVDTMQDWVLLISRSLRLPLSLTAWHIFFWLLGIFASTTLTEPNVTLRVSFQQQFTSRCGLFTTVPRQLLYRSGHIIKYVRWFSQTQCI